MRQPPSVAARRSRDSSHTRFRIDHVFDATTLLYKFIYVYILLGGKVPAPMQRHVCIHRRDEGGPSCIQALGVRALKAVCGRHCVWKLSHGTIASVRSGPGVAHRSRCRERPVRTNAAALSPCAYPAAAAFDRRWDFRNISGRRAAASPASPGKFTTACIMPLWRGCYVPP